MTRRILTRGVAVCLGVIAAAGCMSTPPRTPETWPEPQTGPTILQPGDELRVEFLYWPDLNTVQTIRPDGKISLQIVGEVQADGRTPEQVRDELHTLYGPHLKDPVINVVASVALNQRVFVGGEVMNPGVVLMPGRLTLLGAVMQAGGFNKRSARMANVVVVRMHEGRQYAKTLDVRSMLEDPESDTFYLQPLDVVFVPRSAIDHVGQWVDQYVNAIIPRNFYGNYTWNDQRDSGGGGGTQSSFNFTAPLL